MNIYIYNIKLRAHRNKLIVICHNCHVTLHVRLEEGEADGVLDGEEPPFRVWKSLFSLQGKALLKKKSAMLTDFHTIAPFPFWVSRKRIVSL